MVQFAKKKQMVVVPRAVSDIGITVMFGKRSFVMAYVLFGLKRLYLYEI